MADVRDLFVSAMITDLFRAPFEADQTFNQLPILRLDSGLGFFLSGLRQPMGLFVAIPSPAMIAPQLSADGGFMHADDFGDPVLAQSGFHKCVNMVSLVVGKL